MPHKEPHSTDQAEESLHGQCSACAELRRLLEEHERAAHSTGLTGESVPAPNPTEEDRDGEPANGRTLEGMERVHIELVYRETEFNISKTARILGIDRSTLYNKLRRYGLK